METSEAGPGGGRKRKRVKKPASMAGKITRTVISGVLALVLIIAMVFVDTRLAGYTRIVDNLTGYKQSVDSSKAAAGLNLAYNAPDYSADTIGAAERDLDLRIMGEGTVLLKNDGGAMPFPKGTNFSFFGANCAGGSSLLGSALGGNVASLKESFEAEGFGVNEALWKFYTKGAGKNYGLGEGSISFGRDEDFSINECPLTVLRGEAGLEASFAGSVPVFVMRRVAGEGRDMPRSMYMHADSAIDKTKTYLEPTKAELEILQYLNDGFSEVVLLINSNAALELGWVEKFPNIKAVVFAPGARGGVAGVFSGRVNPSGRTVDTFAARALNSPAAQNFGDYAYFNEAGEQTIYNYVSYKEGIYVGYRYYETRYEDAALGQGNAGGFDYAAEVVYPFGFGLSYTTFEWSGYSVTEGIDTFTVTLNVTNTGAAAGKDVVEIYAQKPYTDYDRANRVEKASAELVAYGKTRELAPNETQAVTLTFDREQLKSYDYTNAKTYIFEAGDYYIAAGRDAHAAVNNILAAKGAAAAGDASLATSRSPGIDGADAVSYAADSYSGAKVTNLFDFANGGLTYLSRSDWEGTFPTPDGEPSTVISTWGNEINGTDASGSPASYLRYKTAAASEIARMDAHDALNPEDAGAFNDVITYGAKNGLELIDMRGLDFDDPRWDALLDQLTLDDYQQTITQSGYGTPALKSVGKPFCVDADTASGLIYGGTGAMFPAAMVLAQTWNQELAYEYGRMIGSEAVLGGADGWYAPSMNIHRTPFSGRNGEYYSEDGFLSGKTASLEVLGAAEKGMYAFIKHYAFNDQENHRGDTDGQYGHCTWLNEQAAREIYLKPFEMCMKAGDVRLNYVKQNADGTYENAARDIRACRAVMSAFNRIGYTWTGGSYALIGGVLRGEWGFNGFVITDNANTGVFMDAYQMIAAGADAKLTSMPEAARYTFSGNDAAEYHYGREAMRRVLYVTANSKAMDGAAHGSVFKEGLQTSQILQISVTAVGSLLILLMAYLTFRRFRVKKNI